MTNQTLKKTACTIVLLMLMLIACQQAPAPTAQPPSPVDPVVVTVEVTRPIEVSKEVVVTQFATVQVPVEVTREIYVEVTPVPTDEADMTVGSADNPIRLVFTPIHDAGITEQRATALSLRLGQSTGLSFDVVVVQDSAELLEQVCTNPDATVAFLTAIEYVFAQRKCDLQISYAGIRNRIPWSASMIVVRDDGEISELADLEGKSWAVADVTDITNSLYFQALFEAEGVEVQAPTAFGTDNSALIATYEEEQDFVTAPFLPPILPYDEREWEYGVDDPEIWLRTGTNPIRSGIGFVVVVDYVDEGGYQVRDARASVLDAVGNIFVTTEILQLSERLPNDAIAYGNQIPLGIASEIDSILAEFAAGDGCVASLCSDDFFDWEGVSPVDDNLYDSIRFIIDTLNLTEADIPSILSQ